MADREAWTIDWTALNSLRPLLAPCMAVFDGMEKRAVHTRVQTRSGRVVGASGFRERVVALSTVET